MALGEFSFRTREAALRRLRSEVFDVLVVGGGITGAAVARDAASRGLSVALVERNDFAYGTSSRSSKLIHGGLRYLENFEFGLVFEALAERALLLKTMPHMVRPLPFYFPVYEGDRNSKGIMGMGMWLYDLLALFRTPGFHKSFSSEEMGVEIPFLRKEGLKGGFRYFDASMWDDVIGVETLRSAQDLGASIVNYVEAMVPIWKGDLIQGFRMKDREPSAAGPKEFDVRARRTVICGGPWTDELGTRMTSTWKPWLKPSKGVHLIFDLKRLPVPGALVMSHPKDGRISFVIPRPDMGPGVTIVGTTDSPVGKDPDTAHVDPNDVTYLMELLGRYFPDLKLGEKDVLSAYVGVRPLVDLSGSGRTLQKVSREHHIDLGPGNVTMVAGGKYTTHRRMAKEIVNFVISSWRADARQGRCDRVPKSLGRSRTALPVNPKAVSDVIQEAKRSSESRGIRIPNHLFERYGAEAVDVAALQSANASVKITGAGASVSKALVSMPDPDGFPFVEAQLRYSIRNGMVVRLEDFYLRRIPLFAARADHGLPWAERLSQVWAEERELPASAAAVELERLKAEIAKRSDWQTH